MAKTISLPVLPVEAGTDCLEEFEGISDAEEMHDDFIFCNSVDLLNLLEIKEDNLIFNLNNDDLGEKVICSVSGAESEGVYLGSSPAMLVSVCLEIEVSGETLANVSESSALLDSGASVNLISESLVMTAGIPVVKKARPYEIAFADKIRTSKIEFETTPFWLVIGSHRERIVMDVLTALSFPLVIGLPWLEHHNPDVDWKARNLRFSNCSCEAGIVSGGIDLASPDVLSFVASVIRFGEGFEDDDIFDHDVNLFEDLTRLPECYTEFKDVFSETNADILPEHRRFDCEIELKSLDAVPPFRPIYNLGEADRTELKKYIEDMLAKGFIRASKSPAGAAVFFVPKKDRSRRLCVDYRWLNEMTVRNSFPLPLVSDLLDRLSRAKTFTKIDLRGAYNLVRIKPGDEWKTAFRCVFGHFEYMVMPFGLANAPAIFQSMMTEIFRDVLDVFVVIYIDDLLIFSESEEEHVEHVKEVLRRLRSNKLYAKLSKCAFHSGSVEFLGFVISGNGISMAEDKVDSIKNWPVPTSVREIQSFLGFVNFYRKFVSSFAEISAPLVELTKKDVSWKWGDDCQRAFLGLKAAVESAPSLWHPRFDLPFVLETDASDFAMGAVLSQPTTLDEQSSLNPVGFYSKKLSPAERNYDVHDKELLAIICALSQWSHYLLSSDFVIRIYTDHKNLIYFKTRQTLNPRQLRWKMFLSQFIFVLLYRKGSENIPADLLSRRCDFAGGEILGSQVDSHILLSEELFDARRSVLAAVSVKNYSLPTFIAKEEDRIKVILQRHNSVLAGHHGRSKTFELIARDFVWPGMRKMIYDYVDSCAICQQSKSRRRKPYGLLTPLPIPSRPWKDISMDFITKLPMSGGFDSVLVVVDRFSKMSHFIPCVESLNAEELCDLVIKQVVRYHGLPDSIVSDRGPQFVSKFWKTLLGLFGIKASLSTTAHPQTDGQTERMNQNLEQYLRSYTNYLQDDWSQLLCYAEFAINNVVNVSTGKSPFEVNYGFNPRMDYLNEVDGTRMESVDTWATNLNLIHFGIEAALLSASERMAVSANRKRIDHSFKVGDQVWLSSENLNVVRPSRKLGFRRVGPFKILEFVNRVAVRLELPVGVRIHPVFHVSLLLPFRGPMKGQDGIRPGPVEIGPDGVPVLEVEAILGARRRKGGLEFLVKWLGYGDLENSWQPCEDVRNSRELVVEFYRRNPGATKPSKEELASLQLRGDVM